MISGSVVGRSARVALRRHHPAQPIIRRGLAAPASGSFQYDIGKVDGVNVASRDLDGPTTTVALVAKAGTRYQPLPGFAEALERFAWKRTEKRSALRITREVELLGGELNAYHSRENLVLQTRFLREDLPYFVELLGEVASKTRYTGYELDEEILPYIKQSQKFLLADTKALAINSAHGIAFHRGLGIPLNPTSSTPLTKYLDSEHIAQYAKAAYAKPNIAVVANGADQSELSKWVGEFFSGLGSTHPAGVPQLESSPSKYYGGEERIAHDSGNTMVIAFPGSSSFTAGSTYKPELAVLAVLLGGQSSIKWSPGFSILSKASSGFPGAKVATTHAAYSDAGLLYTTLHGSANDVAKAAGEVVKALKSVGAGQISKEDFTKAVAAAKFKALESGETLDVGLELTGAGLIQQGKAYQIDEIGKSISAVTEEQVKKAAKSLVDGKATVSAVGDLFVLPFAEELGLNV